MIGIYRKCVYLRLIVMILFFSSSETMLLVFVLSDFIHLVEGCVILLGDDDGLG